MKTYLEFSDAKSSKFWEVETEDALVRRRWGKIGTEGQSKEDSYATAGEAELAVMELVVDKVRRGYRVVEGAARMRQLNIGLPKSSTWALPEVDPDFYDIYGNAEVRARLKGIDVPDHVSDLLRSMDQIGSTNGVLWVEQPPDLATALFLLAHKNARHISEIRSRSWAAFEIDSVRRAYANNLEAFKKLFGIEVPDLVLEFKRCQDDMRQLLGEGGLPEEWDGFRGGIFQHVFTEQLPEEKDAISMRYMHSQFGYFYMFPTDYYHVNNGLIWDLQERCFAPFVGHADGCDMWLKQGPWGFLADFSFQQLEQKAWDADFHKSEFTRSWAEKPCTEFSELEDLIDDTDCMPFLLSDWLFCLGVFGYLNYHQLPDCERNPSLGDRYHGDAARAADVVDVTKYVATDAYDCFPMLVKEFQGNFHPSFDSETVYELMRMVKYSRVADLNRLIKEHRAQAELIGLIAPGELKRPASAGVAFFLKAFAAFCVSEIKAGRPALALFCALSAWESVDKWNTPFAANLLQQLPDDVCHPLIKLVAKLHAPGRFRSSIHV